MNRDDMKATLLENVCDVRFTKVDGTTRDMRCTLKSDFLPDGEVSENNKKAVTEAVLPVWDLDKKAWRSFRIDSVTEMQLVAL